MKYFAPLVISIFVIGASPASGGGDGGGPGRQGKDLPDGTAMPLGKFQEDMHVRQSMPLTADPPHRMR